MPSDSLCMMKAEYTVKEALNAERKPSKDTTWDRNMAAEIIISIAGLYRIKESLNI